MLCQQRDELQRLARRRGAAVRRSFACWAVLLSCGWLPGYAPVARAEPPKSVDDLAPTVKSLDLAPIVKPLIADLDSDSLTQRDAAERAIVALGPRALDALPTDDQSLDTEVKQRLKRIRQTLEEQQAAASARASLITLAGRMPLADALAKLSEQSGNKIVDYRRNFGGEESNPQIDVDFQETPFWEALDRLLDDNDLTTYGYAADQGRCICIVGRSPGQRTRREAASYSGPFRIQPLRFEAIRDLAADENSQLRLVIEITWEPRLQPVALTLPAAEIQATGDGDEPLSVDARQGDPEAEVMEGVAAVEIGVPFELPPRRVAAIAKLTGRIRALTTGRVETFRFDNLAADQEKKGRRGDQLRAGVAVGLDRVRKNADLWELQIRVKFDEAGRGLESHRGWAYQNEALLLGKDSQPITPGAYEMTAQSEDAFGMKYLFDLPDGPAGLTFVYRTPTSILDIPVQFALQDLPLP